MRRRSLLRRSSDSGPALRSRQPVRQGPVVRRGRGGYAYRRRSPLWVSFGYLTFILACAGLVLLSAAGVSAVAPPDWFVGAAAMTDEALTPTGTNLAPGIALALAGTQTAGPLPTRTLRPTATPWPTATPSAIPTSTPIPTEFVPVARASATAYLYIAANSTPIPTPALPPAAPFPTSCDGPGRMNILLLGLDGSNSNYRQASRADALAVLGVNFGDKSAYLLSLPRDLWVPMPGLPANRLPEGKINTAYVWGEADKMPDGGAGYTATVVENVFGLRIDRFAVINFNAFVNGIDAVGGIDINVPVAIHDTNFPTGDGGTMVVDIPAGWVHMDGEAALIYGRTRHQDGDFNRNRRQQAVLLAVRDRVLSAEALPYLPGLVQALYGTVYTNLSFDDVALLGCVGPQIGGGAITQLSINQSMVLGWRAPNGQSALQPRMDLIEPVLQQFSWGQ